MPGPNWPYTTLDADQVLTQSFNEATDRLRVDAEITATIIGPQEVIISAEDDNIAIRNSNNNNELLINPDGSINVNTAVGGATAANQVIEIGYLTSIDGKLTTTPNGLKVDGSAVTQPVSAVSLPLPTGAATEATLASIDAKLTSPITVDVDNFPAIQTVQGTVTVVQPTGSNLHVVVDSSNLPTGAATAANQTVGNASLASIDSKLTSPLAVTGPLTDTQLRATPVPVSGTISGSGNFTVVQPTGSNLHTVVDSGTITVTQATGTNLHTVVDASALPSGAATSALQTTGNASLASIDTKLTSPLAVTGPLTDTQLRASPVEVTLSGSGVSQQVEGVTAVGDTITENPVYMGAQNFTSGQKSNLTTIDYQGIPALAVLNLLRDNGGTVGVAIITADGQTSNPPTDYINPQAIYFAVDGTFSGTLTPQYTSPSAQTMPLQLRAVGYGFVAPEITAPGIYVIDTVDPSGVSLVASNWVSGTATIVSIATTTISGIFAQQAGPWDIRDITGSITLPVGAATDASVADISTNQLSGGQKTQIVDAGGQIWGTATISGGNRWMPIINLEGAATGAAVAPRSLQVGGSDGTNLRTLSTDTNGRINVNNITGTITLPSGAATETTLAAINTKTPALGQTTMAGSTPVAIASNQSAIPVTQSGTWTTTVTQATGTNLHTVVDSGTITVTQATGTNLHTVVDSSVLPTGAATETTLAALNTKVANNYGAASGAVRVAAQLGNASAIADFGTGTSSAQTLRVVLPTNQTTIPVTTTPAFTALTAAAPAAATVGVAAATAVTLAAGTKAAAFTNTSANKISLAFGGGTAVLNSGITLNPNGGSFLMTSDMLVTGAVSAIASAASSNLAIQVMS